MKAQINLFSHTPPAELPPLVSSDAVFERLRPYGSAAREVFLMLSVTSENKVLKEDVIAVGTVGQCPVYVRECVRSAIANNARSVIFAHNHPGGTTSPSKEDVEITERLAYAFDLMDIQILDHIIISGEKYFSFADSGQLKQMEHRAKILTDGVFLTNPLRDVIAK